MAIKLVINKTGDARAGAPPDERLFNGQFITVGSDAGSSLRLNGTGVAPEQAVITDREGEMLLLSSADGTVLNGETLPRAARRLLKDGDAINVGGYLITVHRQEQRRRGDAATTPDRRSAESERTAGVQQQPDRDEEQKTTANTAPLVPPRSVAPPVESMPRNFAAILDSMRTEEDKFYFLIQGGPLNGRRVPLETDVLPLGWDASGQVIAFEQSEGARALVRKNWRGEVSVETTLPGMVAVNGELINEPRNLRNGDRVSIAPTPITNIENIAHLIFHEPASLAAIGALFPQDIPEPVTTAAPPNESASAVGLANREESGATGASNEATALVSDASSQTALAGGQTGAGTLQRRGATVSDKRFLGLFTAVEMLMFVLATLFIAVLVFLALEFL